MTNKAMTSTLQTEMTTWFQSLDAVQPTELIGLWKGAGLPAGHPLDGVLENLGWFGKRFHPDMRVDALLFQWHPDRLVPLDPAYLPIGLAIKAARIGRSARARNLFSHVQRAVRAQGTTAAIRSQIGSGLPTAIMVYDRQPIVDVFRRINAAEIAGMMEVKGDNRRYFFRLEPVIAAT